MIEIGGKKYRLDGIFFTLIFIVSSVTVLLNIFYSFLFGSDLINLHMGIGCILLIYSYRGLFVETTTNKA